MTAKRDAERPGAGTLATGITTEAAWMIAFRWIDRGIGFLSVAILAHLLLPEDFGIVGYAMLIIGTLDLFTGTSTDAELITTKGARFTFYATASVARWASLMTTRRRR